MTSRRAGGSDSLRWDVVDVEGDRFAAVGGSCGNVMAILAWLGWTARPIARLGGDATGDFIREELRGLGVDVASLTKEKEVRSPIVLQRFGTARNGTRTHRFSLTCPGCGRWLPRHRSVTLAQSMSLGCGGDAPNVFYFDRVSPASLRLAETARSRGALVVFEPSSADAESKFQRAVDAMPRAEVLAGTTGAPARLALRGVPGAESSRLVGRQASGIDGKAVGRNSTRSRWKTLSTPPGPGTGARQR